MRGAADSDRGVVEFARLLPGEGDQLLDAACRQRGLDDQNLIAHRQHRHRRQIALPVVGHALVKARGDRKRTVGGEVKRIAVGIRTRRKLGSDQAAPACAIIDHDLLSPDGGKLVAEQASQQVAAAAGGVRHDKADRPGRKILCGAADRRERQDRHRGEQHERTYRVGSHCHVSAPEDAFMRARLTPALPAR